MKFLLASGFVIFLAFGQTETQFEVGSIRPNVSGARAVSMGSPSPGRFHAQNVWLRFLIQTAWNVKDFQVVGGPGWVTGDRYDVDAKSSASVKFDQMRPMLQKSLEERFQLKMHPESREMTAYALVVGKSGHKLQQAKDAACLAPNPDAKCGAISSGPRGFDGTGVTLAQLAAALSNSMQRPVTDETGLAGTFDIHMQWNTDQSTPGFWAPGLAPPPGQEPPPDPAGASIFTVIQEQLGLRLQAKKEPVTVYVIDEAVKPSAN